MQEFPSAGLLRWQPTAPNKLLLFRRCCSGGAGVPAGLPLVFNQACTSCIGTSSQHLGHGLLHWRAAGPNGRRLFRLEPPRPSTEKGVGSRPTRRRSHAARSGPAAPHCHSPPTSGTSPSAPCYRRAGRFTAREQLRNRLVSSLPFEWTGLPLLRRPTVSVLLLCSPSPSRRRRPPSGSHGAWWQLPQPGPGALPQPRRWGAWNPGRSARFFGQVLWRRSPGQRRPRSAAGAAAHAAAVPDVFKGRNDAPLAQRRRLAASPGQGSAGDRAARAAGAGACSGRCTAASGGIDSL